MEASLVEPHRPPGSKGSTLDGIVRGGVAYSLVSIGQKGIPFLLLPLYANVLSPSQFGQIALVTTLSALMGAVLAFGLDLAVFREFFTLADQPEDRKRFISTLAGFALLAPAAITLVIVAGALAWWPDGSTMNVSVVAFGAAAASLNVFSQTCVLPLLRAEQRLRDFLALSLTNIVLIGGLTILCVSWLELGPEGWFLAQLLSALITLPWSFWMLRMYWTRSIDVPGLVAALKFGIPIVPHRFAHWALAFADRAVLALFVSTALVGIYSLGYQVAAVLGLVLTSLNQALMPEYGRRAGAADATADLRPLVTMQILATIWLAIGTALLVPPAILLLLPDYADAAPLVPWFALGYLFYGLYFIPMNAITLLKGDTKWNWIFTIAAGGLNIALNYWLIPHGGIRVPAIMTAVSYALLFVLISTYGHVKYGSLVGYQFNRIAPGLLILAVGYVVALQVPIADQLMSVGARAAWCLVLGVAMALVVASTSWDGGPEAHGTQRPFAAARRKWRVEP